MTFADLRDAVCKANIDTVRHGLVKATFGNASAIDRETGRVIIKPSGVPFEVMTPDDMVIADLTGGAYDNRLRPSSDLDTHLVLYRAFPEIGAVVHTHSTFATIFAQARTPIPTFGTTHADYFHGEIRVTRNLTDEEIRDRYVAATGNVIVEAFEGRDPLEVPAILVAGHGPFAWGRTPEEAVLHATILEEVAKMAWHSMMLDRNLPPISQSLMDRHYRRKHGTGATYGQD
ncbi:L-ribulose-5-phosphate 4-epimerase AraD [Tianweitania sp. BSSL-BM11]|uniref:L-ribulose-5-phosphate 4-epimerase n=1 Tax=Tianweitania aestuarii TaxID=2814886 RepID=A0ABS5RWA6_9HYPH|nr:L-ribulose-5-phosphate 4-epimerase AraD [Tianweitania aestuarii]MBS9721360.1 L-ribulose-5-phosphate 4-epimerase AraD [Tianweitania aestuarii]